MAAGCGSTGISPRPMLMGAAHDALRASNARVSLSCLRVLAHRLPHLLYGLVFIALLFGRGPVLRTCNRVMAHRPTGSTQTDRIRLPYAAPEASRRAFFVKERYGTPRGKGNTQRPVLDQFRSKSRIEIISFASSRPRRSSSTWGRG